MTAKYARGRGHEKNKFAAVYSLIPAIHSIGFLDRGDSALTEADDQRAMNGEILRSNVMDDAQLRTVWQQRQFDDGISHLSQPLMTLMKHSLTKRVRQLRDMAEIWDEVIPESLLEHTALETLHRGVLTVLVDSAAHRFSLQTLLNGGLMREIQARFSGALNKIKVIPGQFYAVDISGDRRYEF
jgi:hypothetical protein